MANDRYLRGSTIKCPKCGSRKVNYDPELIFKGHGPGIAGCPNCHAVWEPFEPSHIWDTSDPYGSFREPCNNCAFRPGSPEQLATEEWKKLMADCKAGARFHCHKGVPIEAGAEHGFAYPKDKAKLRICRGWLNAFVGGRAKKMEEL